MRNLGIVSAALCLIACSRDPFDAVDAIASVDGGPPRAPDLGDRCGDGELGAGEQCDGANLGGASCQSLGFATGKLRCGALCRFDVRGCVPGEWPRLVPRVNAFIYPDSEYIYPAADPSGNVLVAGSYYAADGPIDLGGGPLRQAAAKHGFDGFIAKYDALGAHVFSEGVGDFAWNGIHGIASDENGDVLVTGYMDDGEPSEPPAAGWTPGQIFLRKLDPAGMQIWDKRYPAPATAYATKTASYQFIAEAHTGRAVTADKAGDVLFAGTFCGAVNFGGATLRTDGGNDLFVAKLNGHGEHVWSRRFGRARDDYNSWVNAVSNLCTDDAGNVYLSGAANGPIDFGGGPIGVAKGFEFILALGPDGAHRWSKTFPTAVVRRIACDGAGGVVGVADLDASDDLGTGVLRGPGVVVARWDGDGKIVWTRMLDGADDAQGVAITRQGEIIVGGIYNKALHLGGVYFPQPGRVGSFAARLDGAGGVLGAVRVGDGQIMDLAAMALDGRGSVIATGVQDMNDTLWTGYVSKAWLP